MGLGLRVFFIDESIDESQVRQITYAQFNRLQNRDKLESLPEYAKRRVKCAMVILELHNRKPVDIVHIDCSFITFDKNGKFDQEIMQEVMQDAMRCFQVPSLVEKPSNIIDATHIFARQKYQEKYVWTPTEDELQMMRELIFKKS